MPNLSAARALKLIEGCTDPKSLRQIAMNARRMGEAEVAHAASLRLYEILPPETPGSFEHDAWRSIHALEDVLSQERGRTTRLSRTRQKIQRTGEFETVRDLILAAKPSEGFHMLVERNLLERAFEHVALRHPGRFNRVVLDAAEARLRGLDGLQEPEQ